MLTKQDPSTHQDQTTENKTKAKTKENKGKQNKGNDFRMSSVSQSHLTCGKVQAKEENSSLLHLVKRDHG